MSVAPSKTNQPLLSLEQRLSLFLDDLMSEAWESLEVGGDTIQDIAQKHHLITETAYDPAAHGSSDIAEPGDSWFVFADDIKAVRKEARRLQGLTLDGATQNQEPHP